MASPKGNLPYRLIYELGNAFASRLELVPLIELVTSKCREVLDADGVAVMLLDGDSQQLYFPYFSDRDPKVAERLARVRVPIGKGIAGEVFQTCHSMKIDNVSTDSHFYSGVDKKTGLTTRSLLAAPLVADEVRLGVIEAVNPLGREAFTDNDLALLEALADSVAVAIYNADRVGKLKSSEEILRTQVGALRRDLARHELLDEIIGVSPEMAEVHHLMNNAAASSISVLLVGETGSGKEYVARAIHRMSARADKPFLAVNCAALSEHLLNSELFGHRRGAFTGADRDQPGFFRAASGGIIFLDEIGEMPLAMQPTLLRVLQDGEIISVGDTRPEKVDVRVFSATNSDLKAAVAAGKFRADLYYRVAAFPIQLPPLRARRRDIPLLAARFLAIASERQLKEIREFDPAAVDLLEKYDWPGNIRELQNEIERAVVLTPRGESISHEHLSDELRSAAADSKRKPLKISAPAAANDARLREARAGFEARHIAEVFALNGGNVSRTASALGISRISLQRKIKEYGLR
ncbi:sigma 54-interacting transcriptional regulator [Candidatus Binatus sp.]|uniref:sigma-54-dependent Fis family transcriptional regulator n=1 Tax=Candidatus Binatus sp. TaxID=2811406 RepID=UPI003BB1C8A3